jgi:hypothetical protein
MIFSGETPACEDTMPLERNEALRGVVLGFLSSEEMVKFLQIGHNRSSFLAREGLIGGGESAGEKVIA